MPIEIKELHIKTIVGEQEKTPTGKVEPENGDFQNLKRKIIEECVEQVMKILKEKKER